LILILLSTIAVIVWAALIAPKPKNTPGPSDSPSQSLTPSNSPSPSETAEKVIVLLSTYQGQDISLVVPQLTALGLEVTPVAGNTVPADDPRISQVYDITPLGNIAKGSTVQVYYYQQQVDSVIPNQ
jgi:hypothetical protein